MVVEDQTPSLHSLPMDLTLRILELSPTLALCRLCTTCSSLRDAVVSFASGCCVRGRTPGALADLEGALRMCRLRETLDACLQLRLEATVLEASILASRTHSFRRG